MSRSALAAICKGMAAKSRGSASLFIAGILLYGACPAGAAHVNTVTVNDVMMMQNFFTDAIIDTPAIFFIIDHSTSMSYGSNSPIDPKQPNDQNGNRFKVPSAFIDTLYKKFPSMQIGYAVFQGSLYYRAKDDPLFKAFPTADDPDGAYVPLYKLNATYNGQTGLAVLKRFIETKPTPVFNGPGTYEELSYTPSENAQGGTNINVAFDVAKDAFANAVQKVKECHYIIFLSDGDANAPYTETNAFVKGANVPTTFTICFTPDTVVPPNLVTMTSNIQKNNYSFSNPKSEYWPFVNTTSGKLMNFFIDTIMVRIIDSFQTMVAIPTPEKIERGAGGSRVTAYTINGKVLGSFDAGTSFDPRAIKAKYRIPAGQIVILKVKGKLGSVAKLHLMR